MVFNENGKAVPFTTYGQSAVIDTVCLGLLIRTPTKTSYAQSITPVFHGLLDSDVDSYRNHSDAVGWKPLVAKLRMWDLLNFRA